MASPPHTPNLGLLTSIERNNRKIAPLPRRAKSRSSGGSGSSQNVLINQTLTNLSSSSKAKISSVNSDVIDSDKSPEPVLNARSLSSSIPTVSRNTSQESIQQGSNSLLPEPQPTYSFRHLHNITPRPSIEPEETSLLTSQESPAAPTVKSSSEIATPDHEILQPLHTTYSDEKIVAPGATTPPEQDGRSISVIVEDHSYTTPAASFSSSGLPSSIPQSTENSDLSPYRGGLRQRSVSDASDVSDNNDNDDDPSPYDVRDEEAPPEPFFSSIFQTALQNGLKIANDVASAIGKLSDSSEPSDDLKRLANDARRLQTFQSSDTRTIAVLGDSGEGKSSLINSLLHFPDIAKTGDIGSACTSVVTEYRQKTREHTAPITIEVEYLSESDIEDMIKELLWNYRQIFLPNIEDDKVDPKDYARYQRESAQAWSALEAGFKHHREFNKDLLSDMSEGGLETATNKLIQWAHELEWPEGGNSGSWKATADTADECCEKTSMFMQDRYWPFTKIIRVYLSSQVLKTGVVLADLPGLQDTNLARIRATQTYLMKCDNVFIVAKIYRVVTDQSLKSSLFSILARHAPIEWEDSGARSLNLAVVCTNSEDIKQKTARREFCGPDKPIPLSVMDQLDNDIEKAKKNNNKTLKKQLKRKQEFLLVDARNSHVTEGLQNAYASKIPGGRLEVFCVSNTTYEKYSRKGNAEMVSASGIPALRRFCHTITAGAQLLEAKHFLQSTLSSLLGSVELWATSSPPNDPQVDDHEQHVSIHSILEYVTETVSQGFNESRTEFRDTFREVLSKSLERRNDFWETAAEIKSRGWNDWHWTQYNAWCMNSGNHATAKRGSVNWNSELIWKMRMELAFPWALLEEEIPVVFDKLLQTIRKGLTFLQSQLRAQGFTTALVEGIDFRAQDIEYKLGLARQEFTRELKLIQRCASEPNDSSYIVSEMIPAYRAAASQSGTGKAARQRTIVQGRITDGTLFPQISVKIQANIDELARKTFSGLHDAVNVVLALIASDVEMALASKSQNADNTRNQVDPDEERRKEVLSGEIKDLKAKHADLLASIVNL